jgi:hypothetical protein
MRKQTTMQRWLPSLFTAAALAGSASLCQAQPLLTFSNDASQSPAFYDGGSPMNAGGTLTYAWQSTGGPNGGGCVVYNLDGTIDQEIDPAFNVSFTSGQYLQVTFQMKVDPSSGTEGTFGSGGYGHLQMALRDSSYSFVGVGYATIYPPAANGWVTYTYAIPSPSFSVAHLQFLLQGGGAYSGPVTVYVGDVTVVPVPNPFVLDCFTNSGSVNWNNYGLSGAWDGGEDAPYYNPVTGAGPVNVTPPGSIEFQASSPNGYPGGQLNIGFNPTLFQSVAFDVYYDGPTPSTSTDFGGFEINIANGGNPNYNWIGIGGASFNAGMIGQWTHFNVPCAASGSIGANGFAFQATPGSTAGATPITFHVDNIQLWNPVSRAIITGFKPGTPGGVQMTLDADGTANNNDQEGITSPGTNNSAMDCFWINQTPATYSITLTNFPSPASAPGFDAHIYLCNGDSIQAYASDFGYNQTYSGAPYNVLDYLGLHVQNGTSGGVVAIVDWKTNAPNMNAFSNIVFNFPAMASANGTWTLNFSDNTDGSVVAADGSVNAFTLPDFYDDPNYTGNFSPATSMVQFGVFKNGHSGNDGQTTTLTQVLVTNNVSGTLFSDGFSGPGLVANYEWQVAEYYQDASDRAIWQPFGTAYWIKWNTTAGGWGVLSASNLLSSWGNAGVTYTYADVTGTNTLGAIPTASLPPGNAGFFELMK